MPFPPSCPAPDGQGHCRALAPSGARAVCRDEQSTCVEAAGEPGSTRGCGGVPGVGGWSGPSEPHSCPQPPTQGPSCSGPSSRGGSSWPHAHRALPVALGPSSSRSPRPQTEHNDGSLQGRPRATQCRAGIQESQRLMMSCSPPTRPPSCLLQVTAGQGTCSSEDSAFSPTSSPPASC